MQLRAYRPSFLNIIGSPSFQRLLNTAREHFPVWNSVKNSMFTIQAPKHVIPRSTCSQWSVPSDGGVCIDCKPKPPKYMSPRRFSTPNEPSLQEETSIALLPIMSEDELTGLLDDSQKIAARFGSDASIEDSEIELKIVPWWSYIWDYDPKRTQRERKLVQKLDLTLLTILCLGYFIKNLDQTNISNAYISGMKEALSMNANEINLIDIAWTVGYVLGQLPSQFILTKVRPSLWIPSCELVWTLLTFALAAASTSNQVVAIRFFVGLVESIFYPSAHFLIGSWFRPSELGKRACIFHASAAAAGMFSGYLQAAVYTSLNGVLGKAGWQWLFVMDGIVSLPICLAGYFLIPDLPENTRAFYFTSQDAELARRRMDDVGRAPRGKLGWGILRRVFGRWHVYTLTVLYVIFINSGPSSSVSPFALWLKDEGWPVTKINIIPTLGGLIQLIITIFFAILSDLLGSRPLIMSLSTTIGLFSSLCLAIWTIPSALKWTAFFVHKAAVPYGPLAMSWANEICGGDAEERAVVLGMMNAGGYALNAWLPLLTYPAVDAPRFRKGFIWSTGLYVLQFGITGLVAYLWEREMKRKKGSVGVEVDGLLRDDSVDNRF